MYKKHIFTDDSYFLNSNKAGTDICIGFEEDTHKLDFTKDFAFEARWYYRDLSFTFPFFFRVRFQSFIHEIALRHNNADQLLFYENVGGSFPNTMFVSGLNALIGEWIHVVATWEQGVELRVYLNGVKTAAAAGVAGNSQENFSEVTLLCSKETTNAYDHDGAFKGVRLYNVSINDVQALELFNNQPEIIQPVPASLAPNLVREKLLNQKNGRTVIDTVDNRYNSELIILKDNKEILSEGNIWKNETAPPVSDGALTGLYDTNNIIYSSSIDPALTDLHARYSYDIGITNMPVVVIMHGNNGNASDFTDATLQRFASHKFFAIAVGLRGRDGASGTPDAAGRDSKDIIDAVEYVRTNFPFVNQGLAGIIGYSEGGAYVLACMAKFPGYFNVAVSFFGPSDYGLDPVNSWFFTNTGFQAYMNSNIGPRATDLNPYAARDHRQGVVTNTKGGYLYMFHDDQDGQVDVLQTTQLETEMNAAGLGALFEVNITGLVDPILERWIHGLGNIPSQTILAEDIFKQRMLDEPKQSYPTSGTLYVNGSTETEHFTIFLGDGVTEAINGTNRAATVIYDINTDTYDVTPVLLSGATQTRVIISQGAKSINQIITSQTVLVVT